MPLARLIPPYQTSNKPSLMMQPDATNTVTRCISGSTKTRYSATPLDLLILHPYSSDITKKLSRNIAYISKVPRLLG
jgi:hypothetical protein